jgi:hypothetical protein
MIKGKNLSTMKNKLILAALVVVPALLFSCKDKPANTPKENPIDSVSTKIDTAAVKNVPDDSVKQK